jgi:hypothetical protein
MDMANVYQLNHAARNHSLLIERLAAAMDMAADDSAIRDTAEGESDLPELAAWALRECRVIEAKAKALGDIIDTMKGRQTRLELAAEKTREAVALALFEAGYGTGKKALALPDMTISVTQRAKLTIDDDQLPDEFKREVITIKVDREKVNAAIDAGQIIPGVTFGNAAPSITVRTK